MEPLSNFQDIFSIYDEVGKHKLKLFIEGDKS